MRQEREIKAQFTYECEKFIQASHIHKFFYEKATKRVRMSNKKKSANPLMNE